MNVSLGSAVPSRPAAASAVACAIMGTHPCVRLICRATCMDAARPSKPMSSLIPVDLGTTATRIGTSGRYLQEIEEGW